MITRKMRQSMAEEEGKAAIEWERRFNGHLFYAENERGL